MPTLTLPDTIDPFTCPDAELAELVRRLWPEAKREAAALNVWADAEDERVALAEATF